MRKTKPNASVLLSVIITAHNAPEDIKRMLSLIRGDSLDESEIIIVDDCSSDNGETVKACRESASWFGDRAKVITLTEWGHVGNARNKGVEASRGEWLWICDGDDEIQRGAVPRIIETIKAGARGIYYLPHTEMVSPTSPKVVSVESLEALPVYQWRAAPWAKVIARSVFVPFRTMHHYEDCDWHAAIADRCNTRGVVKGDPVYIYYNMGGNSMADVYRLDDIVQNHVVSVADLVLDPRYAEVAQVARDRLALLSALVDLHKTVKKAATRKHLEWLINSWAGRMQF